MEKYLYLSLDLFCFIVPFALRFYPGLHFRKKWKYAFPAISLTAVIFILWDAIFTQAGVWGFNARYISGLYIGNLPIEEVLFFICIPYACLFTQFALSYRVERNFFFRCYKSISVILIVALLITGILHPHRWYTALTFVSTASLLCFMVLQRAQLLCRCYFAFLWILIPFAIVNGILTGMFTEEPVVWYDESRIIGIRLLTIPIEDVIYALLLFLINVLLTEKMSESK